MSDQVVKDGRGRRIHVGDEVSILRPCVYPGHHGVGEVTSLSDDGTVAVKDAEGRTVTASGSDVNIDWSDHAED